MHRFWKSEFIDTEIFLETANNEKAHAMRYFAFLDKEFRGENINISASYLIEFETAEKNLAYAAAGEQDEWKNMYPKFADVAEQEGFDDISLCFRRVADVEVNHEKRFLTFKKH